MDPSGDDISSVAVETTQGCCFNSHPGNIPEKINQTNPAPHRKNSFEFQSLPPVVKYIAMVVQILPSLLYLTASIFC